MTDPPRLKAEHLSELERNYLRWLLDRDPEFARRLIRSWERKGPTAIPPSSTEGAV